jgi:hypothetical protein
MDQSNSPRRPFSDSDPEQPEIVPQRGSPPKREPVNPVPLSDDGLETAKKRDAEDATGAAQDRRSREGPGVGGDAATESGRPEHDPERPKQDSRTPPM